MPILDMQRDLAGVRLLLVHPGIYDDILARGYPPWGILYIGSACRARGAEIHIADLNGEDIALRIHQLVAEFYPTVIGITGKLGKGAERMRKVVEAAVALTDARIAVGGPLVASFPDRNHALWSEVHGVFQGDGETDFPDWIAAGCPRTDRIQPSRAVDLDRLGIPSWWEGLEDYVSDGKHWPGLNVQSVHVSAARGCTRRCTFCYLNTHYPGHSFRVMSPQELLNGCDALRQRWGTEGFYFVDDCLLHPGHPETEALLSMLIHRGSPYRFGCDLQIQELEDTQFLERMYSAGFRALYVGIEAASSSVRRKLGKGRCSAAVADIVSRAMEIGFVLRASVGVGWPGETEGEMEGTLELIRSLPDLAIDAFRYTPLPRVPLTTYWSRGKASQARGGIEYNPYGDYSEFSSNRSDISDERMNAIWGALLDLEQERHDAYFLDDQP